MHLKSLFYSISLTLFLSSLPLCICSQVHLMWCIRGLFKKSLSSYKRANPSTWGGCKCGLQLRGVCEVETTSCSSWESHTLQALCRIWGFIGSHCSTGSPTHHSSLSTYSFPRTLHIDIHMPVLILSQLEKSVCFLQKENVYTLV